MAAITKIGRKNSGFTIIELLTVIAIIGILAAIAAPSYKRSIIRSKEASLRNSLFVLRDVIDQYYADQGNYPDSLNALVDKKYIRSVPEDPFTKSVDTWITVPPDSPGLTGVYDVHSGSKKISLYGTPYNEW